MRTETYHRRLVTTATALLVCAGLVGTPAFAVAPDRGAVLAEAWVTVEGPEDLKTAAAVGLTVAEGRRALPDGRSEQRILASPRALAALREAGYAVRVERADHRRGRPRAGYRPPEAGDALLADLAGAAGRAGWVVLGESVQGRPITGLWLGQPPASGAPTWRVVAAHHGDEWSSFEVALDLAETLATGDGSDPGITGLLDEATVWVVPYVNPDGVEAGSRYNASDVDLNRNYDFEWSAWSYRGGDGPFSEPETRAIRTLAAYGPPLASLSLHSGAENIGYVWNYSTAPTPEEAWLEDLAVAYAETCGTPGFYATNGADWYVTNGDTNDWSYGRYGGMDFTVELTGSKTPPADQIPVYVAWHRDAILDFLSTPPSLSGTVTDAATGAPVEATVVFTRGSDTGVRMATHAVAGSFHRVAEDGAVTLRFDAPGYAPVTRTVTVGSSTAPALAVSLEPRPLGIGDPEPRRVVGSTRVDLPGAPSTGIARLVRPAHADVVLPVFDGAITVDGTRVAPGPWSVVLDDGTAWPRGLFVQDRGAVLLTAVEPGDATWTVRGSGFAPGTAVYALVGPRRTWRAVPVISEGADRLVIDPSGLPLEENVDLMIVSRGVQVAALGLRTALDTGFVDTGPRDTFDPEPPELVRGSCSCGTGGGPLPALSGVLLFLVLWRRRP